ncbi:MAG: hypothetical protein ACI845_000623 [Gammaproteobacteria bacterium]|jgi:hypothetical protein
MATRTASNNCQESINGPPGREVLSIFYMLFLDGESIISQSCNSKTSIAEPDEGGI